MGYQPLASCQSVRGLGSSRSKTPRVAGNGINYIFPLDDLLYHRGQALHADKLALLLVSELLLLREVVPLAGA